MMTRTLAQLWFKAVIFTACLNAACSPSRAQTTGNPLVGAWSGGSADGSMVGTDVYNSDGTFISTARVNNQIGNMLIRVFARYSARQIGPNQMQVDVHVMGYFPRQICSTESNGTNCRPFSLPNLPSSMTLTFLDQNTIQGNGAISHRDYSPGLSQMQVPEVAMVQGGGGGSGGGGGGPVSTCALGSTVCDISGWRKVCERWPAGNTDWMQHGVRCRNGYGQPEF